MEMVIKHLHSEVLSLVRLASELGSRRMLLFSSLEFLAEINLIPGKHLPFLKGN